MHEQPRFTIIIPAYNYGHSLERALRSALNQTYPCYQVYVINDGSTDNTAEVVQSLKDDGLEFDYVEQENGGLSRVRNRGVVDSRYEWLIFLDADDEMLASALENFASVILENHSVKMVVAGHESLFQDGQNKIVRPRELSQNRMENLERYLTKKFSISNGACAMHKSIFADIAYREDLRQAEDIPVFSHVLAYFDVAICWNPVVKIYKHPDSMRHNITAAKEIGMGLGVIIFDESGLPEAAQSLRKSYHCRRVISLLKMCYRAGDYHGVVTFYSEALVRCPKKALSPNILRRYIVSLIRR